MNLPLQNVHVRINDAVTGQPIPVRLRVTDDAGNHFAPFGHESEFPTGNYECIGGDVAIGQRRFAYIDGACEIALPTGKITIEASKGPEYKPLHETITLLPGKMALRFALSRTHNFPADGWVSIDCRCHDISPHTVLLEAAAEGLNGVQLLIRRRAMLANDGNSYDVTANLAAYSGQKFCLSQDGADVQVGTLSSHPFLGQLALIHTHRAVYPLTFGGTNDSDDWSLDDWSHQAHRKGGLVVWVDVASLQRGRGVEALAQAILGNVDAIEVLPNEPSAFEVWSLLANAGVVLPLVASSGKCSNRMPIGAWRTYVQVGQSELSCPKARVEAIKAGRTFVTSGPLLRFTVEDGIAHAEVLDGQPTDIVEIVHNGSSVVRGVTSTDLQLNPKQVGWLSARVWRGGRIAAQYSATNLGSPACCNTKASAILERHLQAGRDWVIEHGRFTKVQSRTLLLENFDLASEKLRKLAASAQITTDH